MSKRGPGDASEPVVQAYPECAGLPQDAIQERPAFLGPPLSSVVSLYYPCIRYSVAVTPLGNGVPLAANVCMATQNLTALARILLLVLGAQGQLQHTMQHAAGF